MPRIQFSDVTPPERRSIRDIPIPNSGKRKVPISIKKEKVEVKEPEQPAPDVSPKMSDITFKNEGAYEYYYPKEKKVPEKVMNNFGKLRKKQWIFGAIIVLVIGVFIVSMMTVFSSATIVINPKNQNIDVDMKIEASRELTKGSVRYEIIKLAKSNTVSVPAAGEEMAELKASGKIIIYNNFSEEPQRLIVRTRFESPEGFIYRIPESVVVPGKTIKNGVGTPGSIEVTIFADEAGEKYNIKKTDFTIPGFKNDAVRFKNFYARSTTNIEGGFVGKQKTVLPADKQTALQNIDTETNANLEKELASKVPEGLVLLPGAIQFKSSELPTKEDGSSSVLMGKEVTAYAFMLNIKDLSDMITNEYVSKLSEWENIKHIIKDFSLLNITGLPDNFETADKISLQIKGETKIWADINNDLIKQKLLGAPKNEVQKIMDEFIGISSITSTIKPMWKKTFPKDSPRIHIQTAYDQ